MTALRICGGNNLRSRPISNGTVSPSMTISVIVPSHDRRLAVACVTEPVHGILAGSPPSAGISSSVCERGAPMTSRAAASAA